VCVCVCVCVACQSRSPVITKTDSMHIHAYAYAVANYAKHTGTTHIRDHFEWKRVETSFPLLTCLRTHRGRQCEPFSGQNALHCMTLHLYNFKIFPGLHRSAPVAWTQTPISAWLASVRTVPVLTHISSRYTTGVIDVARSAVETLLVKQGTVGHVDQLHGISTDSLVENTESD